MINLSAVLRNKKPPQKGGFFVLKNEELGGYATYPATLLLRRQAGPRFPARAFAAVPLTQANAQKCTGLKAHIEKRREWCAAHQDKCQAMRERMRDRRHNKQDQGDAQDDDGGGNQ